MINNNYFLFPAPYKVNKEDFAIKKVFFTIREIDILSCMLSGRSAKSIAVLLNLSYKTVETHVRNIFQKTFTHSKEDIINLIESSNKLSNFKNHYIFILSDIEKNKLLDDLAKNNNPDKEKTIFILDNKSLSNEIKMILEDLSKVNIAAKIISSKNEIDKNSYLFDLNTKNQDIELTIVNQPTADKIDLQKSFTSYKIFLCELLKIILNISEKDFENKISEYLTKNHEINETIHKEKISLKYNYAKHWKILSYIVISISIIYNIFSFYNNNSDLISNLYLIPKEKIIQRDEKLTELKIYFNSYDKFISNPVAIILGIGGSGKTTLASIFANNSNAKLVWKLNAESYNALSQSFYELLDALSSKNDSIADEYKKIKETSKKNDIPRNLFNLIQKSLKKVGNWVLVYDDLTSDLGKVLSYIPYNTEDSGNGKIIITTRNNNLSFSLPNAKSVNISELSRNEKLQLFDNIYKIDKNNHLSKDEIQEITDSLPPYPLDISTAAYYTKITKTPSKEYLEAIKKYSFSEEEIEKNILDITGVYYKTRQEILNLSVNNIIHDNPKFKDILFYLSMISYQDISTKVLYSHYEKSLIDKFIFSLQKHSFVTNMTNDIDSNIFSIHMSFHDFLRKYFFINMKFKEKESLIIKFAEIQENYIRLFLRFTPISSHDFIRQNKIISHMTEFLENAKSITDKIPYKFLDRVGNKVYILADYEEDYERAEKILKRAEKILQNGQDNVILSSIRNSLGGIYLTKGQYKKAIDYLEKSQEFLLRNNSKRYNHISSNYCLLGDSYRAIGQYKKAELLIKTSVDLFTKLKENKILAFNQMFLGKLYSETKNFKDGKKNLINSINVNKKYKHEIRQALAATYLGDILIQEDKIDEALKYLNFSYNIYKHTYGDHDKHTAKIIGLIGIAISKQGDISSARKRLKHYLNTNKNFYKNDNSEIAMIYKYMADLELLDNKKLDAIKYYRKSFKIFNELNHPKAKDISDILNNKLR